MTILVPMKRIECVRKTKNIVKVDFALVQFNLDLEYNAVQQKDDCPSFSNGHRKLHYSKLASGLVKKSSLLMRVFDSVMGIISVSRHIRLLQPNI